MELFRENTFQTPTQDTPFVMPGASNATRSVDSEVQHHDPLVIGTSLCVVICVAENRPRRTGFGCG